MKKCLPILFFFLFSISAIESKAQFLLSLGMDVYKTDNYGFARKTQIGIEGNYFVSKSFAVLGGLEMWSGGPNTLLAIGGRWYIVNPVFLKFRGLLGPVADISLGMGYSHALDRNWRIDFGGDYYYNPGDLALRVGLGYKFN